MNIIDSQHPFFKQMWRRVVVVVVCLAWGVFEFLGGYPAWSMLFVATGIYCGWIFFYKYSPPEEEEDE